MRKPYPYELELKDISNFEKVQIKYKCPHCDTDLSVYKNNEKFCHNCGEEINWGVTLNVNKEMFQQFIALKTFEEKVAFFNAINQMNNSYKYSSPCFCKSFNSKSLKSWDGIYNSALKKCIEISKGDGSDNV